MEVIIKHMNEELQQTDGIEIFIPEELINYLKKLNIPADSFLVIKDQNNEFQVWSTPCAANCPGIKYYPKIHHPHYPLYPVIV